MSHSTRRGRLLHQLRYPTVLGCVGGLLALTTVALRPTFDTPHLSSQPVFVPLDLRVVTGQRQRCPASPADALFTEMLAVAFPLALLAGAVSWAIGRPCAGPMILATGASLHFWVIPSARRQALALDGPRDVTSATTVLGRLDDWIIAATVVALAAIHWQQSGAGCIPLVGLQVTTQAQKASSLSSAETNPAVDHYRVHSTIVDGRRVIEIKQSITISFPLEDRDFSNVVMVLLNRSVGPDGGRYLDQATIGKIFGISRQAVNVRISTYNRSERIVDVTSGRRHDNSGGPSSGEGSSPAIRDDLSPLVDERSDHDAHEVAGGVPRQEEFRIERAGTNDPITDGQKIALTTSFQPFLWAFEKFFQRRSFHNFLILATGWILTTGRHTVTGVIRTTKGYQIKSFSAFHTFFSRAIWAFDDLWRGLFKMYLAIAPADEKIELDGDDTLARKNGDQIRGAGMHHDPLLSRPKRVYLHFGHNWVALAGVVRLPFMPDKSIAIPLLAKLYRPKKDCKRLGVAYRTHTQMMQEMVTTVASWAPDRSFVFAGDSAYGCKEVVKHLPANVECVSRVRMDAALYEPASPPAKGTQGRPRKKGERLPTPKMIAEDPKSPWTKIRAFLYGKHVTTTIKVRQALWYTTAGEKLLLIVVVRDPSGERHDEAFFSTDLTMTPQQVVERYARRWPLETLFWNAKQCMGFEDPQNRTDQAVERTAPFALFLTGLVVLWFAANWRTAQRFIPQPGPWYTRKDEVGISFADMLSALRQMSYREMIDREADGTVLPRKLVELVLHLLGTLG